MSHPGRYKTPAFLAFAHAQHAMCSVCRWVYGEPTIASQLHHYGDKGIGQRCDDTWVTPVCRDHHEAFQGKRFLGFIRAGEHEVLAAMQRGNIELLAAYTEHLEGRCR